MNKKGQGKLQGRLWPVVLQAKASDQGPPYIQFIIYLIKDKAGFYYQSVKGMGKISLKKVPVLLFLWFLVWLMLSRPVIHIEERERIHLTGKKKKMFFDLGHWWRRKESWKKEGNRGVCSVPISEMDMCSQVQHWEPQVYSRALLTVVSYRSHSVNGQAINAQG